MSEVLNEETINIAPAAAKVAVKTIVVEPGSWEEHVGAVGEAEEVYRVFPSGRVSDKRLGIVFDYVGRWAIAAEGHVMYEFPGGSSNLTREDVIWFLDKCNQIVRDDSPKYEGEPW